MLTVQQLESPGTQPGGFYEGKSININEKNDFEKIVLDDQSKGSEQKPLLNSQRYVMVLKAQRTKCWKVIQTQKRA